MFDAVVHYTLQLVGCTCVFLHPGDAFIDKPCSYTIWLVVDLMICALGDNRISTTHNLLD